MADIKSEYPAGLRSESVAGFELECMADFIGIRTLLTLNIRTLSLFRPNFRSGSQPHRPYLADSFG